MPSDSPEEPEPTYQDVLDTRKEEEFVLFAQLWIQSQTTDWGGNHHLNLMVWSAHSPVQALAIILNIIDEADENGDDMLGDAIGLGPVEWFLGHCPESFHPVVREAVLKHPGFTIYTTWKRENPDDPGSICFGKP